MPDPGSGRASGRDGRAGSRRGPSAGGRPRDPGIDDAVRATTLRVLARDGYAGLSLGTVAREASTSRPAIYRRWPSKRHLVVDAVASTMGLDATPDTGELRADLVAGIGTVRRALDPDGLFASVLPGLIGDLHRDPELLETFLDEVWTVRRRTTRDALETAVRHGRIRPDFDREFVLDALAAPIYHRALFRHGPLDERLVERTVDMVLRSLEPDQQKS